jgi:hypothetical protein
LLVEWPERGGDYLPEADFIFRFGYAGEGRDLNWHARSLRARSFDFAVFSG